MTHERFDSEPSVAATANRLRLVRLDLAGEDPQVREENLAEELKRVLAKVPPGDRAAFQEQLTAHFPSWDSQVDVATRSRETVPRSGVDERELADWSFLVTRLIAVWPSLSEGEQQAARDRLVAEGLVDAAPAIVWRDDTAKALQQVLGLSQDTRMDPIRALGVNLLDPSNSERLKKQLSELGIARGVVHSGSRKKYEDVLKAWRGLSDQATDAREDLLDDLEDENHYFFRTSIKVIGLTEFIDGFWARLGFGALKLLANEVGRDGRAAWKELQEPRYKSFPLVALHPGGFRLRPGDVQTARDRVDIVFKPFFANSSALVCRYGSFARSTRDGPICWSARRRLHNSAA